MSILWLLVVKGNLRHRIEKLGVEKADSELTEDQRRLREIALQQFEVGKDAGQEGQQQHPERPHWANGAFVYLTDEHAAAIQQAVKENCIQLQSKHVLVSEEHRDLVKRVLATGPQGSGREAFLLRRAGAVESEEPVRLPSSSCADAEKSRGDTEGASEASGEQTRSAGDYPGGRLGGDEGVSLTGEEKLPGSPEYPPHRKHVRLLQLDQSLMESRDVDLELAEYLTAPASVQQLDPDMWTRAWTQVCEENDWIEMRDHEKCGPCPFCTLCNKWAEVGHLMGKHCRGRQDRREKKASPLLEAILHAEGERRSSRAEMVERAAQAQAAAPAAGPAAKPPAFAAPTAQMYGRAGAPATAAPAAETYSRTGAPARQETGHRPPVPPPPPPPPRDKCQKHGCPFRRGGAGSRTHCCKRCEYADRFNWGRPLTRDPDTGEPWRQAHGPMCTSVVAPPPPPVPKQPYRPSEPDGELDEDDTGWETWRPEASWGDRGARWVPAPSEEGTPSDISVVRSRAAAARELVAAREAVGGSSCLMDCLMGLRLILGLKAFGWGARREGSEIVSSTDNLPVGTDYMEFQALRAQTASPAVRLGAA